MIVHSLLARHVEETESPRGRDLLTRWEEIKGRFTRVLPAQYARVREVLADLDASGGDLNAPGAWAEFLEVTSRG
ncbi:hypothetical protein GCM10025876_36560 [Demequina litorisediminis]|uniref:Uncharacterized protein n=1 Tax=Demequina litorisediminis TaxID=1849022 RepID=A0ABQ6IHR0_9MICO|nr:hypothetical protein GCM10025876_36560 [Demequina litorisediminis]